MDPDALRCALFAREVVGRCSPYDAGEPRHMQHAASEAIVEILGRLIKRLVVCRPAVHRENEHPLKPGFAEISRQVHEDRSQRCHADWIAARKSILPAHVAGREGAELNLGEPDDRPSCACSYGVSDPRGNKIALIAVAVRWKIWSVLFQDADGDEHRSPRAVELLDLFGVQLTDV